MSGIHLAVLGMSFGPLGPTVIGQAYGGGYYAGLISTTANSVATHYLIVSPKSSGETSAQQKTSSTSTSGTSSRIDGPTNSANMNNASHPAAQFCEGLTIGGYTDWYLPAIDELQVCYYELKPTTASNNTGSGANSYSVPSRGNYSAGTPAQTSATDFQTGNSQAFSTGASDYYWSSTEELAGDAYSVIFTTGFAPGRGKTNTQPVRAIRRIPVV